MPNARSLLVVTLVLAAACDSNGVTSSKSTNPNIVSNPCSQTGTLTLAVATTAIVDCSNGGTTVTLAANGANYLIVPEFATDAVAPNYQDYEITAGNASTSASAAFRMTAARIAQRAVAAQTATGGLPARRNLTAQRHAERVLRQRAEQRGTSMISRPSFSVRSNAVSAAVTTPPALHSMRSFHIASSFTTNAYATSRAQLAYIGQNILIYVDSLAPANGFTDAQLQAFGALFDQTLYPIDTAAFGGPSDIDNNGRAIMLMSPYVNGDTPKSTCANGFVAGFFDPGDFDGPSDTTSNQGEIFYSIVPDPLGQYSCPLQVTDVDFTVPSTFMHELQHLINFSQHVVVSGGAPGSSWFDEGLSIVAEELGSLYYENKCGLTACRTSPTQMFPDSSQGFIQDFLYDSYAYALLPDTATITLSSDDEDGFAWRGGAWLFARYLGDQYGNSVYRQLEKGPANAILDVQSVTGQSFQTLFGNFGLALYTDSLPGFARTTAPAVNRFTTRNLKAMWARLFATSNGSSLVPFQQPIQVFPITTDTSIYVLLPGTTTFNQLSTLAGTSTITVRFSAPGAQPFLPALRPQFAIFRLPPSP